MPERPEGDYLWHRSAARDGRAGTVHGRGAWENWKDPDTGEWVRTLTIITTDANELVGRLHDRMPVVIAPEDRERWLKGPNPGELLSLTRPSA